MICISGALFEPSTTMSHSFVILVHKRCHSTQQSSQNTWPFDVKYTKDWHRWRLTQMKLNASCRSCTLFLDPHIMNIRRRLCKYMSVSNALACVKHDYACVMYMHALSQNQRTKYWLRVSGNLNIVSQDSQQSFPSVHFMWPNPTQPIDWLTQPNPTE